MSPLFWERAWKIDSEKSSGLPPPFPSLIRRGKGRWVEQVPCGTRHAEF